MKHPKHNGKRKLLITAAVTIFLAASLAVGLPFFKNRLTILQAQKQDLSEISSTPFNAAFISMYPIDNYSREDFTTYRGIPTVLSSAPISSLGEVSSYVDTILSTGNQISNLYLGLDAYEIWNSSGGSQRSVTSKLQSELLSHIAAHPEITFEILFAYPSLDYWTSLKASEVEDIFTCYRTIISTLDSYSNVVMFFPGFQQWLISNPGHYESEYNTTALVSQKLMLFTFCDGSFEITLSNADTLLNRLSDLIDAERSTPTVYPDLSNWQIVFFGDSNIGNYKGSLSIPGIVSALSGAEAYNYGIGGTPATDSPDADQTFPDISKRFLTGEQTVTNGDENFVFNPDRQLCFILSYGLNDYFNGSTVDNTENPYDTYTYCGALRSGIRSLREVYPDAKIILMVPNFTSFFSNGTEINSATGGQLTDYANAVINLAAELEVSYVDTSSVLGINADTHSTYLADGVHLNENGRFLLGGHIASVIE